MVHFIMCNTHKIKKTSIHQVRIEPHISISVINQTARITVRVQTF